MKSETENHKKGLTGDRTYSKNVATKLPGFKIDDCYQYRPVIEQFEKLNKLADEIKSTPSAVVNLLVNIGLEVMERSIPKLKDEVKQVVNKKIKHLLK